MSAKSKSSSAVMGRKPLWIAIVAIIAWLGITSIAGPTFGKLSTVQENDNAAFLPDNAESTLASKVTLKFSDSSNDQIPTLLVFLGDVDPKNNPAKMAAIQKYLDGLGDEILPESGKPMSTYFVPGFPIQAFPSEDGKAALVNIALSSDVAQDRIEEKPALTLIVDFLREDLKKNFESQALTTHVTGFGGIFADLFGAFGSIDSTLLTTTLLVVSLILIVVYRSPLLWILPLFTAVTALSLAGTVVYYLAKAGTIDLNGQSQGILSVLVLGAATDYALLLIARYREELHHHESRFESMRIALRGVVEPIIASGSTVIAGLLVLLLSQLSGNRGLGPVGAIGIASAMVTVLTLLPALLVVFGRWIFWPKVPKFDDVDEQLSGTWAKIGAAVEKNPKRIWISTAVILTIFAGFSFTLKADGLANTEAFTARTDSVIGLEELGKHFPSGEGSPVEIVIKENDLVAVTNALGGIANVAFVEPVVDGQKIPGAPTPPIKVVEGKVLLNATLKVAPDSVEARNTIPTIREAVHKIDNEILVGGGTAVQYDTDVASRADNRLIIPIVLLIIGLILGLLLRSIAAAALLLLTVVLSFMATLGVCQLVFEHVFGFAGADASFPLFAFIFLVALGIDYNIFLMTRVREEALKIGTRKGVIKGLTVTGGVITSAGIVLAATFAVLGVLPLVFLAELGFAVAFGVLLDTVIVRSLLVPALVHVIGPKIWWPSKLQHEKV
ncbi:putative drug exporter of the RND superfamily [Candidatus Nanopelagicus hibericus]|uniref:Putative drug exporter of the RND superfamily n=1 Tax=Candidatus Nanopelagicus hibericus TaxID=1884915 RepID=A0A249K926_9ACTN|nr:MMPL family transporter [Candidatus Nanopelagicus hibericus]ASY13225.1 putative drug exporter of the RND superfamily [Candidatus Nanopelagicus hibericus]